MFKRIFERVTIACARYVRTRSSARIIGVSGSVGKTGARYAIIAALEHSGIACRYSKQKDFNTPLGIAYTILGIETYLHGISDIPKWFSAIIDTIRFGIRERYIVVEYGLDAVGDPKPLLDVAAPDIAVITSVAPVHMAGYESCDDPEYALRSDTVAVCEKAKHVVYNADDERITPHLESCSGEKHAVGTDASNEYSIMRSDITHKNNRLVGTECVVKTKGSEYTIFRNGVVGAQLGYAAAVGLCVGTLCGVDAETCVRSLSKQSRYPLSRMRVLPTRAGYMIDDSYNASPEAVHVFLDAFEDIYARIPDARYAIVLGSMNELGKRSESYHREVAERISIMKRTYPSVRWYFCGIEAKWYKNSDEDTHYASVTDLIKNEFDAIAECDSIWIKGSQNNVRLDMLAAKLLPKSMVAAEHICRQTPDFAILNL